MSFTCRTLALTAASILQASTLFAQAGHWEGKVHMPNHDLAVALDLARNASGVWIGSITIPETTAMDVPLGNLVVGESDVRFTAALPEKATFEAKPFADRLSGQASNAEGAVPFELTRTGDAHVKVPPPSSALAKEFEGTWEGAIVADGQTRRVLLTLARGADGTAVATLISVDRGNLEIPVTTVTTKDGELQLESRALSGNYRGTLGANGDVVGEWSQRTTRLPLTFHRSVPAKSGDRE